MHDSGRNLGAVLRRGIVMEHADFEQLERVLATALSRNDRIMILQGMADVGDFEQLNRVLCTLTLPYEREVIARAMSRITSKPIS
jgi:hypothetical protein